MSKRFIKHRRFRAAAFAAAVCCAAASFTAVAQEQERARGDKPAQTKSDPDVLDQVGNWFDRQFNGMKSDFRSAKDKLDRDTDRATKGVVDTAKDAADAVTNIPGQRTVRGREVCRPAPNGAPDCESAANVLCRGKGFGSGKSMDATTAENCPARVLLSGRQPGEGECKTETFISRALCTP